jgi:hypothetical protein
VSYYSWDHACELPLETECIPARTDCERWVFAMFDERGNEVYRNDITDRSVLNKEKHSVPVYPMRFSGNTPVRYCIWPRLDNHVYLDRHDFDVPARFMERYREVFDRVQGMPIPERTVTCDIFGGLGNQLFQVMTTLVFARENDYVPLFDIGATESRSMVKQKPTYWNTLFAQVVADSGRFRCNFTEQRIWSDPSFTHHPIPRVSGHLRLWGYFSSFRYFDHQYGHVNALVRSNPRISGEVDAIFDRLSRVNGLGKRPLVSVHVRRGDSLQNPTLEKPTAGYYARALASFGEADFLVFSDDAGWCRSNLGKPSNLHFVEGQADYVDLLLMAKCDHHVIANSTFGWWGAYLNPEPSKRVIYPYPWFAGEKGNRSLVDFIPSGWTSLPP